jgi:hypothetical protein
LTIMLKINHIIQKTFVTWTSFSDSKLFQEQSSNKNFTVNIVAYDTRKKTIVNCSSSS